MNGSKSAFLCSGLLSIFLSYNAQSQIEKEETQAKTVEYEAFDVYEVPQPESPLDVHEFVDVDAEFPGGSSAMMQHIKNNLVYPQGAVELGIQGKVYVSFVVQKDGSIDFIHIDRSPDELLSAEAIRIVKTFPKMKPGQVGGQNVASRYRLPINFVLSK